MRVLPMRVLIDTNVLFSAALNPNGTPFQAYVKAVTPPNTGIICRQNIEELRRTFNRKLPHKIQALESFLAVSMLMLEVVPVPEAAYASEKQVRDVNDRPILRAAIHAKADVILTGDKDLLERYAKEAKALRAFGYYCLVTTFGGVPLLTQPMLPAEVLTIPRASEDNIYTQIIQDLTDASTLPAKGEYDEADAYRLTRGFAKAMLAKTYMFRGDFTSAETVLHEMVETDGDYQLLPDYGMNWRPEYENGSESVFEIPNKVYDRNIATGTNVPHYFTSRGGSSSYQGYGFHVPTQDLYDAFDADDPRITYIFTRTGDRYAGDTEEQDNSGSETGFHDYKMTVPSADKVGFDPWMISYNIRMIRYADILLLYAEVLNENGKPAQALTYLNQVRSRARNTNPVDPRRDKQVYVPQTTANTLPDITVTDQSRLREIIWHERRCELAMEGWRRDDLMRQKRFGEVMHAYAQKYDTSKGRNFDDARDYLLPVPQGEIDRTNGILVQNPGY